MWYPFSSTSLLSMAASIVQHSLHFCQRLQWRLFIYIMKHLKSSTLIPLNFLHILLLRDIFTINSYIRAQIIFAHWQNIYFPVSVSYNWKCSASHCVKYAKIRAFSIFQKIDRIVSVFSRIWTESEIPGTFYNKIQD